MRNKIEILFEDEEMIVVAKPPCFLSIPDRYATEIPNLQSILKKQYGQVLVVHRLDRETSGVICFARTAAAHKHLNEQFQERRVEKYYWVLLEGVLHQQEGVIDKPIAPNKAQPGKMLISQQGKPSVTSYKVLESFKHFTLAEANIKTGRTHQIRVHFHSIGYPPAVDAVYGRRSAFILSQIKGRSYRSAKTQPERPLMSRTALHARRLLVDHPANGSRLSFEAPLPKDFKAVLQQLRKWGAVH